jgi:hypothetical protein
MGAGLGRRAALIASVMALALAPASARAAPASPTVDPFYVAPPSLASAGPGAILRSRKVDVTLGPAPLTGVNYSAYQLLYRSNDATGQAIANVTTIIVPDGAAPAGGRQLLSVNDAEDSVDPNCAPSYQLQTGEQQNGNLEAETSLAANQLALGRDLVIPDAEGPKSEYIVTGMEGHATLDSIRAAERFPAAQLAGAGTAVGLIGYSGGGHVTAAANELAPAYAPELNIVGVAGGGVPVGNRETFAYLDGSVGTGVLMATSIALDHAFPQMNLFAYLNAKGKAFAQQVSTGCATSVFAAPYAHYDDWTTVPDAVDLPQVAEVIATNSLGHAAPTAPTFYYNAINDELITIKALDKLVAYYCANGSRIDYFRDPAGFEHIQGVADFFPLALNYLTGRFNGDAVPNTCGPVPPAPQRGATGAGSGGARSPTHASCLSVRFITLHPRVPPGVRERRLMVFVNGRAVSRTGRRSRVRISLVGRPRQTVTIDVLIIGSRHGRAIRADDRRVFHTCMRARARRARTHSTSQPK